MRSRARRLFLRVDCRGADLGVLLRDLPIRARVIDWSEGGIGLLVPAPVPSPPPGQPLEARLLAGDRVLGVLDLVVRHASRDDGGLRIGASVQSHAMSALWRAIADGGSGARPIAGEADVESFYRTWFRAPEAFIVRGTGPLAWIDLALLPKGLLARPETFDLMCPQAADVVGLVAGQPIDLLVLAFGAPHLVRTEIVAVRADRLTLRLPGRLFSLARRDGARFRCATGLPCFFEAEHPLDPGRRVRYRVRDLSATGLSMSPDADLPVRPGPGSIRGRLLLPFAPEIDVDLDAKLRSDGGEIVVAARFAHISPAGRRHVGETLLKAAFPEVDDRDRYDPWGVWEFLRAAGYLPDDAGEPGASAWEPTRRAGPELSHDVVRLQSGTIVGHLSCLRLYRRTWLVHQLAASLPKGELGAGAALVDYGATFLDTRADDMRFMIAYYNQRLPWHRLFFQGYERRMADPELAVVHPFHRYQVETTGLVFDRVRDRSTIAEVGESAAAEVSAFLRAALPHTAWAALDLEEAALLGEETAATFADRGLEWKRVVLAQRLDGRLVGVAVCELATPGLNAFGITDVAKIALEPGGDPGQASIAQRALLARVKGFYLANRRERFFLLLDASCSGEALEAAGATFVETTGFVAFSRAGLLDFRSFLRYEMARLGRLGARKPPEGFGVLGAAPSAPGVMS